MIVDGADSVHITTATTTQVFSGTCVLKTIVVGTTAGNVTIIDNTVGVAPVKSVMTAPPVGSYEFNLVMHDGIRIITSGAADLTVLFTV